MMLPGPQVPGADLPVRQVLAPLLAALRERQAAVLVAPPGAGKTTLVPLAVADQVTGRVIVAEPRRVAVRAAARRMAALTGGTVGDRIGYTVRGDSRTSARTRVEVVTTGVLVQRLQRDPELAGVDAVILDEVHERHLDSDLALAFVVDVRATLRPDLWLLATSATADADRLAAALDSTDSPAPVLTAVTSPYPVAERWCPPTGPVDAPYGLRVDPRQLDHVAAVIRLALSETDGDLLAFLPGAGELNGVARRLDGLRSRLDIVPLHGRLAGKEQDAALRPGDRRRVVLATAVAESSLTVPGVRVVVDAGLARVPRIDLARGLGSLVTVRVSRSSARQRAGRAGREGPGTVYHCWSEADHGRLAEQAEPEISGADLTAFMLQLARWGHPDGTGLSLLDRPPAAAAQVAMATLAALGAVDAAGRVTARGRLIGSLGAHPRLARALLDAAGQVTAQRAAEVVAMLSADSPPGPGQPGDDIAVHWRRLRDGTDAVATAAWKAETRRLLTALPDRPGTAASPAERRPSTVLAGGRLPDDLAAGLVIGLAFPERLARARPASPNAAAVPIGGQPRGPNTSRGQNFLMAGGTAAELAPGSPLTGQGWLAIASADRQPGAAAAKVRLAAVIDEETALLAGATLLADGAEVTWADGDVQARQVRRLGAVTLAERPLAKPDPALVAAALAEGLRREGMRLLRWTPQAMTLRDRIACCRAALGEPWPRVDDETLLADPSAWLGPELAGARRAGDLHRINLSEALRRLLPWPQAGRLDELVPERLAVPSGSMIRIDYAEPAKPVLAVKVQEVFGLTATPTVVDGRVPVVLHLLSPAGRPVAVTADLISFWRTGYPQVRGELRGRYPRHPWPEDPMAAPPTRRLQPRR